MKSCIICGISPADKTHVKSKGSGGSMASWNIVLLCRKHHREQHQIGILTFFFKHEEFVKELEGKGWYLVDMTGREKLWNDKLNKERK